MFHKEDRYPDKAAYQYVVEQLWTYDITLKDIAEIAFKLQHKYNPQVPFKRFVDAVQEVMHKREVLSIAMTGLSLDEAANKKTLPEPLQTIIGRDYSLYGVDELLALGIAGLYGTIGETNYSYADKEKSGLIKELDESKDHVTTFVDDLVGAIAAAAGTKIAFAEG